MFLALLLIWFVFAGALTLSNLIYGIVVSGLLTLFCAKFLGYRTTKFIRLLTKAGKILAYLAFLFKEIVKANLTVLGYIYRRREPQPVLVRFHSGLKTEKANVLVANSITLTPGTITVEMEGDDFTVHALDRALADGIESCDFIRKAKKLEAR